MWEHVSQYLAQLGGVGSIDALKVHLFYLSLTGTTFSWFSSLSPNSIDSWEQLECKFYDHFYCSENELKLSDLTLVRQGRDESVTDYIRRFRDTKNRCFNLTISEMDMADLAFNGLHSYLQEKLDGHTFITLPQLQQKASAQESRSKENKDNFKHTWHNVNYVDCDSNSSIDESNDVYAAEFCCTSKAKSYACDSLTLVHKNRPEEIKFTFDVAKCDKFFDELHKVGCIKMTHTIPPLDELKQKAYCWWHNSFSHATNDCNIFRRQVQSAINEWQLSLKEMQVEKNPFSVNTIDLQNFKVLIQPEQAETAKGKNVVIGEKRTITIDDNVLSWEVVLEKTTDGKESLKIIIKASTLGGQAQAKIAEETVRHLGAPQPVGPAHATGQTVLAERRPTSPIRLISHIGQTDPRAPRQ
jgi:hypothetical protein